MPQISHDRTNAVVTDKNDAERERESEKENLDDAGGVTEAVSSDVVSEDQVLAGS